VKDLVEIPAKDIFIVYKVHFKKYVINYLNLNKVYYIFTPTSSCDKLFINFIKQV